MRIISQVQKVFIHAICMWKQYKYSEVDGNVSMYVNEIAEM